MNIKNIKFISNIPRAHSTTLRVNSKSRGFTLLEVLVATSIFAMIMLITTGTIAQSSTYRSKLAAMRQVNEETRKLADQITRDVREANGVIKLDEDNSAHTIHTYNSGIAFVNWGDPLLLVDNITPRTTLSAEESGTIIPTVYAQTLIVATKDQYKMYLAARWKSHVYYKTIDRYEADGSVHCITSAEISNIKQGADSTGARTNRISLANTETKISFSGFAPDTNATSKQQAYVSFLITSKSRDSVDPDNIATGTSSREDQTFNNLTVLSRATSYIRSFVTVRNYSN